MIHFKCPQCGGVLEAPDHQSGEKFDCPTCGQRLKIPPPPSVPARNKTVLGTPVSPLSSSQPHPASMAGPAKSVIIGCPACSARISMQASPNEKQVHCPKCGAVFRVKVKGKSDTHLPLVATTPTDLPASAVQPLAPPQPDAAIVDSPELAWVKRLLSLPWVILILIFGFLPWSEWNIKKVRTMQFGLKAQRHELHLADTVVPLLHTQSGYQALYGGTNSPLDVREQINRLALLLNFRRSSFLMACSPFMMLFWTAALAMLALVWWTPLSASRLKTFLAFGGLMTAMLLITLIWGTPLELNAQREVEKIAKEDLKAGLIMNAANTRGKTLWFWLTFAAVLLVGVSEATSNLMWKTRDFVSPIAFIGIRMAAVILAGTGVGLQIVFWTMYGIDVDEGDGKCSAGSSSLVWWAVVLTMLVGVLALGAIWLYQRRARYSRAWTTALANPTDREFLREVIQLSLFALAVSGIGGAFADFWTPRVPLNLIFSIGLAAAALLCLLLFPIFRRQGLGLAAFCLLFVALGFSGWWGLATITGNDDRGFLASRLPTIRDWQEQFFRPGGNSKEGKEGSANAKGAQSGASERADQKEGKAGQDRGRSPGKGVEGKNPNAPGGGDWGNPIRVNYNEWTTFLMGLKDAWYTDQDFGFDGKDENKRSFIVVYYYRNLGPREVDLVFDNQNHTEITASSVSKDTLSHWTCV